ncbi:hypothetical protein EDD15DRAFT_597222 [Pisolithus albus]|nr:hypothetical protein EDD15DRAFT_597222 [Pisolithus albus]
MSPFIRDVGQILLDNGSALRELSDAFLCLWTWPGNEDDDEGPSDRLTTSRTTTLTYFAFVSAGQALGAAATALFAVCVSLPAIVFLTTLSLLYTKLFPSPSPSLITPVVIQSRVPRTTLILVFLSLSALSFLMDGLAYITLHRAWSLGTGISCQSRHCYSFGVRHHAGHPYTVHQCTDRAHLCSDPKLSKCIPDIFYPLAPCVT